ncbi:precorrin-4 C(11)-methyltransferase [Chitinophaga sancti]|uniref:Precorrin-4 C(11)-methyltransferase n=1 Tax=Chitinophaga sancti TaxID=1004 RepID=A0A1K1NHL5_9BACT|nr:precorrin-4 C(11)-methyltransferase [Chitinophaga sancti]WQD63208.1 precorrin-4 C(11)-methyltransferase [Chitinophaga sancti]WQG91166.1 precorrin-4 C(11)-methyltransferase [Chitinophaga sancti]SFW34954.1 precorrin-4 C11-methyltransferase [Chitinophaga sancti]
MNKTAIIASTDSGVELGLRIMKEFPHAVVVSTRIHEQVTRIPAIAVFLQDNYRKFDNLVFIGALGICVRSIAPHLEDKHTDPAVINMDDQGHFVQAVVSGHEGGANALAAKLARATAGQAVITTSSDLQQLWALDTLAAEFNWKVFVKSGQKDSTSGIAPGDHHSPTPAKVFNQLISLFVNKRPTAVLLDLKDKGTQYLERTKPAFADIYYAFEEIDLSKYELLIAITYKNYEAPIPVLHYHAPVLNIGMGCSRDIEPELLEQSFREQFQSKGLAVAALKVIGSIDIKADETAFIALAATLGVPFVTFTADELNTQTVPNASEVVLSKLGVHSVSEASAMLLSGNTGLLLEKQKITVSSGKKHTLAIAIDKSAARKGEVVIVGAGPGDAALISIKGKQLLETADLILYAGSLVPEELTHYAKAGAVVRNSASMTLEDQIALMEAHYAKGHLIVRLQSGDPSIYGAIQEQMTIFDEKGMEYAIVPGISSFQAAAAYLKSEFTIPEVVQSIILTRGAGKTPLPENEKLNEMARHKATMCIFLSATIAKSVQAQLLEHYAPETPVAVLYRVTWKDEAVYTGQLKDLAQIIRDNKLTLTTLVIVGDAIGARKNRSHLYSPEWKHTFRTGKAVKI